MSLSSNPIGDLLSSTNDDVNDILSNILNLNVLEESSEKGLISPINNLIASSRSRQQGLEFLILIIDNFSSETISSNSLNWLNHCLVKYPGDSLKEIKLIAIGKIVNNAFGSQDFSKRFVSEYISKVLDMCLSDHSNPHELEASLNTLTICMKYYASWFNAPKQKLESFLEKCLDQKSANLVEKAAIAFLYLQQVGNAGLDGNNHKANFSNAVTKLCATIHSLYGTFFEKDADFDPNEYKLEHDGGFTFTVHNYDSQKMLYVTARRITNCLKFLMIMLRKSFPVNKEIKPEEILDVIKCALNVHSCLSEENNSAEDYQSAVLLIDLQTQCLQLLRILIVWGQTHLIPYTHLVSKILIDALGMCQRCSCFSSNSVFQETIYKVLSTWLRVAKSSLHPHFQEYLVSHILRDITPIKSTVTLNIDLDLNNSKSSKAKRRAIRDKIIASGTAQQNVERARTRFETKNRENSCAFALDSLKQLLIATDLQIKTSLLKDIYAVIITSLLDLTYSKHLDLYTSNPQCQEKLYETLVAIYEQPGLKVYPPLQLTLTVLQQGLGHCNRHVMTTCQQGLNNLEKLCQPLYPPLYTPQPGEYDQQDLENGQGDRIVDVSFESMDADNIGDGEDGDDDEMQQAAGAEQDGVDYAEERDTESPAWSAATEDLNGDKDERVEQQDESDEARIVILKNEVLSHSREEDQATDNPELPSLGEIKLSKSLLEEADARNTDEPCSKKIKLSNSLAEVAADPTAVEIAGSDSIQDDPVGAGQAVDERKDVDEDVDVKEEQDEPVVIVEIDASPESKSKVDGKDVPLKAVDDIVLDSAVTEAFEDDSFVDEVKDY